MMLVRMNQRELTTESNRTRLSIMRFWLLSSSRGWSYSLRATQKMMDVTFSKQWIHFLRSLRWPPTSNMLRYVSAKRVRAQNNALDAQLPHGEARLVDARRLGARAQHVGLDGDVVGRGDAGDLVEEAGQGQQGGGPKQETD